MSGLDFLRMMKVAFGHDLNAIPEDKFAAALDRWHEQPIEKKEPPLHQCTELEDIKKCRICSIM